VPPGTRGDALRPVLRFFEAPRRSGRGFAAGFTDSPWTGTFRGGTRISAGLRVARQVIERESIAKPSVLLVSDLDDSAFDTGALSREIVKYREGAIDLRIVPLFPPPQDRELFMRLAGPEAFVQHTELLRNTAIEERRTLVGSFPWALVLFAAALLLVVALNERTLGSLEWRKGAPA